MKYQLEAYAEFKDAKNVAPTKFKLYRFAENAVILKDLDLANTTSLTNYLSKSMIEELFEEYDIKGKPLLIVIGSDEIASIFDYEKETFKYCNGASLGF